MTRTHKSSPPPVGQPIAVVAERTGLSQDTLRAWERRYDVVRPMRDPAGQRLYTDEDIERLRLLQQATRAGRAIGHVAGMSTEALAQLVANDLAARERHAAANTPPDATDTIRDALALTRALDAVALDMLLRRAAARWGTAAFIDAIAAPLLRRIGDEWHAGRLTPAQEHVASTAVYDIFIEAMRAFTHRNGAPALLVTTPAGERHAIGAALAAAAAAIEGWGVLYLGPDLPAEEIAHAARTSRVRAVAISIVYVEHRKALLAELRALRNALPPGVPLIAGGAGASTLSSALRGLGIDVEPDVAGLTARLRRELGR